MYMCVARLPHMIPLIVYNMTETSGIIIPTQEMKTFSGTEMLNNLGESHPDVET